MEAFETTFNDGLCKSTIWGRKKSTTNQHLLPTILCIFLVTIGGAAVPGSIKVQNNQPQGFC